MTTPVFKAPGIPLFKSLGTPAHGQACCCGGFTCPCAFPSAVSIGSVPVSCCGYSGATYILGPEDFSLACQHSIIETPSISDPCGSDACYSEFGIFYWVNSAVQIYVEIESDLTYSVIIQWGFTRYTDTGPDCLPTATSAFAYKWTRDCTDGTGVMTFQGQDFFLSFGAYDFLPCFTDAPSTVVTISV